MTVPWENAGGPNECAHGYAEGIPCERCDQARADAIGVVVDIFNDFDDDEITHEPTSVLRAWRIGRELSKKSVKDGA